MQTKTRRSFPRRVWLWALLATFTVACENADSPTETVVGDPSFITLDDGGHGGNPRFFFLPPLTPSQRFFGTLDTGLDADVIVEHCLTTEVVGEICPEDDVEEVGTATLRGELL